MSSVSITQNRRGFSRMSTKCMNMKMNILTKRSRAQHHNLLTTETTLTNLSWFFFQRKQNQNWTNICIEIVSYNKCSVCEFYCRWLLCHQQSTNEGNVYIRNWEKRTWKRMESESVRRPFEFWSRCFSINRIRWYMLYNIHSTAFFLILFFI